MTTINEHTIELSDELIEKIKTIDYLHINDMTFVSKNKAVKLCEDFATIKLNERNQELYKNKITTDNSHVIGTLSDEISELKSIQNEMKILLENSAHYLDENNDLKSTIDEYLKLIK